VVGFALLAPGWAKRTRAASARVVQGHHEQPIAQSVRDAIAVVGRAGEHGCYIACEEEARIPPVSQLISFGKRKPAVRVVFNGQPSPWFEQIVWMGFPFNNERFFFVARMGNKEFLYEGLRRIGAYDGVTLAFAVSKDGKTFAYAARRGNQWFIVRNGQETPVSGGAITDLVLSPDGSQIAYALEQAGKQTIIANGKPVGGYQQITLYFIGNDGKRLVYEAKQGGKRFLVADGKQGPPYTLIRWLSLADDGRVQAYVAQAGGKQFVVWHGRRSPPYDEVGIPSLSRDGKQVAYPARIGNRWTIVVNGQKRGRYDQVESVQVGEDGNVAAAAVQDGGQWFVMVDGRREGPYDSVNPTLGSNHMTGPFGGLVSQLAVGAGSRRVGYAAEVGGNGSWLWAANAVRRTTMLTPLFSAMMAHM